MREAVTGDPAAAEESKPEEVELRHSPGSEALGAASQLRRALLGVTQEDVAEKLGGPSVATLRTIENAQADNYRAKTLFSLDGALAWPRGTSVTLLTGDIDRLDENFRGYLHEELDAEFFEWGPRDFNIFFNHITSLDSLSEELLIRYDIPFSSPKSEASKRVLQDSSGAEMARRIAERFASQSQGAIEAHMPMDDANKPRFTANITAPEDNKFTVLLRQVLKSLSHYELRQFADMLRVFVDIVDEPIAEKEASAALSAYQMAASERARIRVLVEQIKKLSNDNTENPEYEESLRYAQDSLDEATAREAYAANTYHAAQFKLEQIERRKRELPEGFDISIKEDTKE